MNRILLNAINLQANRENLFYPTIKAQIFADLVGKHNTKPLEELIVERKNGSWGKDYIQDGKKVKVLRSPDIRFGYIDFKNSAERYVTMDIFDKNKLLDGDILVIKSSGSADLVGKSQLFKEDLSYPEVIPSNFLMRIRPNQELIRADYLDLFLKSPQALEWRFKRQSTTTGLRNLNTKEYLQLMIPLPKKNTQKNIVEFFNNIRKGEFESDYDLFDLSQYIKIDATTGAYGKIKLNFEQQLETIEELRQAILQEAVQGKLVPQDPNDEPASELLKRIKVEKEQLIADKKIKKAKPLPPITNKEIPYELPQGWVWCRLGNITNYGKSDKTDSNSLDDDTWVLDLEDVEKITSRLLNKVRLKERPFKSNRNIFFSGDVLYGKLRPYLDKVVVADENGVCTTEMLPIRGYLGLHPWYLRIFLKSPSFIEYANNSTHGMTLPRLSQEMGRLAIFSLPPENEQKRIVAKVDELMSLCDQLGTQIKESKENTDMLMQAVLQEAFEA